MSSRGLLSLLPHPEGSDRHTAAAAHGQQDLCHRSVVTPRTLWSSTRWHQSPMKWTAFYVTVGKNFWCVGPSGDGGNDVSMIQAAHCGIGIEGKVNNNLKNRFRWFQSDIERHTCSVLTWDLGVSTPGGKAGVSGCRFLHHSVQTHRAPPDGSRQEQLQTFRSSGSVRHAPRHDHLHHAGALCLCVWIQVYEIMKKKKKVLTRFTCLLQAVFSSIFFFASVPLYQGFLMVGYVL